MTLNYQLESFRCGWGQYSKHYYIMDAHSFDTVKMQAVTNFWNVPEPEDEVGFQTKLTERLPCLEVVRMGVK
jgi:hypothetical protein